MAGLVALVLSACSPLASGQRPVTSLHSCGIVEVHVVNDNPGDVQVHYAGRSRREWIAPGLRESTHFVPRALLRSDIPLTIVRGGINRSETPVLETTAVMGCEATIKLGHPLAISFFFGADVRP